MIKLASLVILIASLLFAEAATLKQIAHLNDFQVIEFRRYTVKEGERENFARYFESYFPDAFQQLGAICFGQFMERKNPSMFTWIRGFKNNDGRGTVNSAFYYGPLWREHSKVMNDRLLDASNVLRLRPLNPDSQITILPAVDPVAEKNGAQGIVIAQIFQVKADSVETFAQKAGTTFAAYRDAGARQAGVLITFDGTDTFPQLPFRTDGPHLVWLGILQDDQMLETRFLPVVERNLESLSGLGLLRNAPELLILDPTSRSRLRWM